MKPTKLFFIPNRKELFSTFYRRVKLPLANRTWWLLSWCQERELKNCISLATLDKVTLTATNLPSSPELSDKFFLIKTS